MDPLEANRIYAKLTDSSTDPWEVPELRRYAAYAKQRGVSLEEAFRCLDISDRFGVASDEISAAAGSDFGSVRVDVSDGRPKVAVANMGTPAAGPGVERLKAVLEEHGLGEDTDIVSVRSTHAEVVEAAEAIGSRLSSLFLQVRASLRVDRTKDELIIDTAQDLTAAEAAEVRAAVASVSVAVAVQAVDVFQATGKRRRESILSIS